MPRAPRRRAAPRRPAGHRARRPLRRHPPWHDVQLEVRGPAVGDLGFTFRERWDDPTPLDHRNPWRLAAASRHPRAAPSRPAAAGTARPGAAGSHAVQVLRTYPAKRPPFPFAPEGERSIARAYLKAFRRARRLVYLEDQYLWSPHAARRARATRCAVHPSCTSSRSCRAIRTAAAARRARRRASAGRTRHRILRRAGGDRVAVYDLENAEGTPIYVHAKVCVIDDVLLVVGSDNLNRRSWTHDSEVSCAVIDAEVDERTPDRPGRARRRRRRLARATRLELWREHLGREAGDDADLLDPVAAFAALAAGGDRPRPLASRRPAGPATTRPSARAPTGTCQSLGAAYPQPCSTARSRSRRPAAPAASGGFVLNVGAGQRGTRRTRRSSQRGSG